MTNFIFYLIHNNNGNDPIVLCKIMAIVARENIINTALYVYEVNDTISIANRIFM